MIMGAAVICGGPMAIIGSLDANGVAGVATSSPRSVSVPDGSNGTINFSNYIDTGTITNTQYKINSGSFTTIADGNSTTAFVNGDTITVRTNGNSAGEQRIMTLTDNTTGRVIATVIHTG